MSQTDPRLLANGHYARKQIFSRNRLVAWSHSSRFELARRLVAPHAGGRVLDYGSGDGTFLALVHDLFPTALGVDIEPGQVSECAERVASLDALTFATTEVLADAEHAGRIRRGHVHGGARALPPGRPRGRARRAAPRQRTRGASGDQRTDRDRPALPVKQAARAFAALSGLREYQERERYSPHEFVSVVFAGPHTSIARQESRSVLPDGWTVRYMGHKGFNWRALEEPVSRRLVIERRLFSPIAAAGPWLHSQVWFLCRPR